MEENPHKAPSDQSFPPAHPKQKLIDNPKFKLSLIVFIIVASIWMVSYEIFKGHSIAAVITAIIAIQCLWALIRRHA